MVVVQWDTGDILGDVLEVVDQILFGSRFVEEIGQKNDAVNTDLLSMFTHIVHISDISATDAENHGESMFAAHFQPFFGQTLAFIYTKSGSFSSDSVHENTLDALGFKVHGILLDDIVVDGFPENNGNSKRK